MGTLSFWVLLMDDQYQKEREKRSQMKIIIRGDLIMRQIAVLKFIFSEYLGEPVMRLCVCVCESVNYARGYIQIV